MHTLLNLLRCALLMALLGMPVRAEEVLLTGNDLVPIQPAVWAASGLVLPELDTTLPIVGSETSHDGVRLLRLLSGQGDINGFAGIVYDNRDRGHSALERAHYPSLTHLNYGPDLVAEDLDYGLAGRILLPAVVLGNSSMAVRRGPARRSLPRLAMTNPFWRTVTPALYANNHVYVYPEHRDYDGEDKFPINWPYMIISEGSSGSDRRFLNALALTLAAFPRDTFEALREQGLVAPTLQMILRRNLATVSSRADYLSGRAHPPVFNGRHIQAGRMVAQASELRSTDIPPLVRLRVIEEDFSEAAGLANLDERLLDTPAAIGRLWRSFAWERELTVTAEDTFSVSNRLLTFEWRLLRGDPELVRIEPEGPGGRTARIRVAWHDPWTEPMPGSKDGAERRVSRVDIGVFANNDVHDSAPAIISIDFPEHQIRRYGAGNGSSKRLLSIDYDAAGRGAYFDPLLYWSAPWTDATRYDESGRLSGWDRRNADGLTSFVPYDAGTQTPHYEIDTANPSAPILRRVEE